MPEACVFCDIVARKHEASIVYEDDDVVAFLDTRPVNTGHTLVVPRRHAANLAELDPEDGARIFQVAMVVAAALRKSGVRCEGINFRINDGVAAGQRVFHVHLHVMPRFEGDILSLRSLDLGPPPSRDNLNQVAQLVRDILDA